MVAHEGGNPSGEYALTLNLTDVSSGWTKTACDQKQGPEVGFRGTGDDFKADCPSLCSAWTRTMTRPLSTIICTIIARTKTSPSPVRGR